MWGIGVGKSPFGAEISFKGGGTIYAYMSVYLHVRTGIWKHMCIYDGIDAFMYACKEAYVHICRYTCIYANIYGGIYAYMLAHMHRCKQAWQHICIDAISFCLMPTSRRCQN